MKKLLLLFVLINATLHAQDSTFIEKELSISKFIDGTLLTPTHSKGNTLAILIAGSGPTDRNGNQNFLRNNSLKKLAETLSRNGVATFRYDKRVVKQIKQGTVDKNISFDDFINDAIAVIDFFKNTASFEKIYVIGHSQGSLVGMIAAQGRASGFISIAGAGQPIDEVITYQVEKTANIYLEDTKRIFKILKSGKTTTQFPVALTSIFNLETQPFMMSWMKYNPKEEIKKLDIPVLILNGTKDLQVSVEEATTLKNAYPEASFGIIKNMNHLMFIIEGDDLENSKSYNESHRNISKKLIEDILSFIN